jgi:hypothetical protein
MVSTAESGVIDGVFIDGFRGNVAKGEMGPPVNPDPGVGLAPRPQALPMPAAALVPFFIRFLCQLPLWFYFLFASYASCRSDSFVKPGA